MKPLEKRRKLTGSGLRLLVAHGMALLWLGGLPLTAPAQQGPPGPDTNQPGPSAQEPSAGPEINPPAGPAAEPPMNPGPDLGPPPEQEPDTDAQAKTQEAPEQKRVAPAETIRAAVQTPTPSVAVGTNAPTGTNLPAVLEQKLTRGRESRRRTAPEEDAAVGTGTNLMAFKIIYERNIFNPNRGPRYSRRNEADAPKPVKIDGFSLVGTLMSDKGAYAFFDGTEARYQAALQTSNKIAGYTVAAITPSFVTLRSPSNSFDLVMNMQMRKQDEGDWELTVATGSWNSTNSASSTNATVGASDEEGGNDAAADAVMKRLMKKREEELKK
jgi:hypothetical protein